MKISQKHIFFIYLDRKDADLTQGRTDHEWVQLKVLFGSRARPQQPILNRYIFEQSIRLINY